MNVEQIYQIVNSATQQVLGESAIVNTDLSNMVDIGSAIIDANARDNYVGALFDETGKTWFASRVYDGISLGLRADDWTFGSRLRKIQMEMPDAEENENWMLVDGQAVDNQVFYRPEVTMKVYNQRETYCIPMSIPTEQVDSAMRSGEEMIAFIEMIYNTINKSLTVKLNSVERLTLAGLIGRCFYDNDAGGDYTGVGTPRCVNLLALYNADHTGATITKAAALHTPDFLRYAAAKIGLDSAHVADISTLFNLDGKERFTPPDRQHFVLLADFAKAADVYLQSDTFHEMYTALPKARIANYWQGSGTGYDVDSTSAIHVNVKTGANTSAEIVADGILGVLFDEDAAMVCNQRQRVTSHFNAKGDFTNYYYKSLFNSLIATDENCIVWYIAEEET